MAPDHFNCWLPSHVQNFWRLIIYNAALLSLVNVASLTRMQYNICLNQIFWYWRVISFLFGKRSKKKFLAGISQYIRKLMLMFILSPVCDNILGKTNGSNRANILSHPVMLYHGVKFQRCKNLIWSLYSLYNKTSRKASFDNQTNYSFC